jgi:membrane-associated phospholipid phosphatase
MLSGKKQKNLIIEMKRFLLVLIVCLISSSLLHAEERDTLVVKKAVLHGLSDSKNWVLSPLKWNGKDWAIFGGVSIATGALIKWGDQSVYNFANTLHTPFLDKLTPFVEPLGNGYLIAAISGTFLQGIIAKNNYSIETSLIATESLLLNTLLVQAVKNTAGRIRPNDSGTSNPHQWNGPFFRGNSFFSGHTSSAFSVASVYAYRYRETVWVPVLSYGLASLVGMERIYDNRHWASDVFFGAAAGTATGIFLCKQWEKNSIKFYPTVVPGGAGISLVIPVK